MGFGFSIDKHRLDFIKTPPVELIWISIILLFISVILMIGVISGGIKVS